MNKIRIQRTRENGSIVTFIIVGVILVFGLVGTAYLLKQHSDQVRREQAVAEAEKRLEESKDTDNTITTSTDASNTTQNDTSTSTPTSITTELPVTGPEVSLGGLVGIYMLTAATVGFTSSIRKTKKHIL